MTSTEALWAQFSDRLRAFIGRRIRDENDVQDVLQEVFARIHSGAGTVRDVDRLEAWLFQIARRSIVDHLRKRSGKRRSAPIPDDLAEDVPPSDVSREVASWLTPMMSLLSEEDREALRLADVEGLRQKDLATRQGLSVTGAKSRIQRARKRLKDVLLECCHIEMDRRGNAIGYARKGGSCGSCSCS